MSHVALLAAPTHLDLHELAALAVSSCQVTNINHHAMKLLSILHVAHNLCSSELHWSTPACANNQLPCALHLAAQVVLLPDLLQACRSEVAGEAAAAASCKAASCPANATMLPLGPAAAWPHSSRSSTAAEWLSLCAAAHATQL
jgi:hypothetical protein